VLLGWVASWARGPMHSFWSAPVMASGCPSIHIGGLAAALRRRRVGLPVSLGTVYMHKEAAFSDTHSKYIVFTRSLS
jgi:hypothetical protein